MTLSAEAATDPNSNTVMSGDMADRETSTAPFMPGTSGFSVGDWVLGSIFWLGLEPDGASLLPFHQEIIPMAVKITYNSVV